MKVAAGAQGEAASELISRRIAELGDWRGETLARIRKLIRAIKLTFPKGASLADPAKVFNASLEGNVRRAIDIRAGDRIDEGAFKSLIKAAVAANASTGSAKRAKA